MVSNSLKITEGEVVAALKRLRAEQGESAEYKKIRKDLPKSWPI